MDDAVSRVPVCPHPTKGIEFRFCKNLLAPLGIPLSLNKLEVTLTSWASNADRKEYPKRKQIRFNKAIELKQKKLEEPMYE